MSETRPGGRLPVTVIGGYLGTGKTTLVNRLLRAADGQRLAVLVNDFRRDAGRPRPDRVVGRRHAGDFRRLHLLQLRFGPDGHADGATEQRPDIERVVLETSGVALPGMVASAVTLLPAYRVDGIVVMVDAETVRTMADDAYLGDTITRQLGAADLVVANRCDLVDEASLRQTLAWLATQSPAARILPATRADIAPDLLLGLRDAALAPPLGDAHDARSPRRGIALRLAGAGRACQCRHHRTWPAAERTGTGVLRAKGILNRLALHVVGQRFEIDSAPGRREIRSAGVIGLRARLDRRAVEQAVQASLSTSLRSG